jgi:hypothetical protein
MAYLIPDTYLLKSDISKNVISNTLNNNNTFVYDYKLKSDRYDKLILDTISDLSNNIQINKNDYNINNNGHVYTPKEINKITYDYIKQDVNCKNLSNYKCSNLLSKLGFTGNIFKLGNKIDCRNKSLANCIKNVKISNNKDISYNDIIIKKDTLKKAENNLINVLTMFDSIYPDNNNNYTSDQLNELAFQYIKRNLNCKTHTNKSCGNLFYNYGFVHNKGYQYELYHNNIDCSKSERLANCIRDLSNNKIIINNYNSSDINNELYNEKKGIQKKVYKKTGYFITGITFMIILIYILYKKKI